MLIIIICVLCEWDIQFLTFRIQLWTIVSGTFVCACVEMTKIVVHFVCMNNGREGEAQEGESSSKFKSTKRSNRNIVVRITAAINE